MTQIQLEKIEIVPAASKGGEERRDPLRRAPM